MRKADCVADGQLAEFQLKLVILPADKAGPAMVGLG